MTTPLPTSFVTELRDQVAGRVRLDVPLSRLSTYRIGGPAAVVVSPSGPDDVSAAVRLANAAAVPWLAIGLGSNLLFDDGGMQGIVIRVAKGLSDLEVAGDEGEVWTVGAGLPTPILARRTAAAGFSGVHRLVGVPGALGGGVFMNAGAHGQEFQDVVASVDVIRPDGSRHVVPGSRIAWQYRHSGVSGVIVGARLHLTPADPAVTRREVQSYLQHRRAGTPFDRPCCGSVFRNPPAEERSAIDVEGTVTAGRLIDLVGMKGFAVGGAEVSTIHANYVVNTGGATAADVRAVVSAIQTAVAERFGIQLRREVKYVTPTGELR